MHAPDVQEHCDQARYATCMQAIPHIMYVEQPVQASACAWLANGLRQGAIAEEQNSRPAPWCHVCIWSGGENVSPPPGRLCKRGAGTFTTYVDGLSPLHGALTFIFHHSWHKCAICLPCTREKAHSNILTTRISGGAKMTLSGRCEAGSWTMNFTWSTSLLCIICACEIICMNKNLHQDTEIYPISFHADQYKVQFETSAIWGWNLATLQGSCMLTKLCECSFAVLQSSITCMTTGHGKFLCMAVSHVHAGDRQTIFIETSQVFHQSIL